MLRKTIVLALALAPTFIATPARAEIGAWVPLQIRGDGLATSALVDGQTATALLSLSAVEIAVSEQFIDSRGLHARYTRATEKIVAMGGETVERPVLHKLKLQMGGERFTLMYVPVLPADMMAGADLRPGGDWLRTGVVQVDFPNGRWRYIARRLAGLSHYRNLDVRRVEPGDRLLVAIDLADGERMWMEFGSVRDGELLIRPEIAARRGWVRESGAEAAGRTTGGSRTRFRIPALQIGPFALEDVPAVTDAGANRDIDDGDARASDGVIGYELLRHFLLTLDFSGGLAHIDAP